MCDASSHTTVEVITAESSHTTAEVITAGSKTSSLPLLMSIGSGCRR